MFQIFFFAQLEEPSTIDATSSLLNSLPNQMSTLSCKIAVSSKHSFFV